MLQPVEAPRLMALPAVIAKTSLSEPTIRRMVERSEFPRPVKISVNRIAWREPEVNEWINARELAA